MLKELDIQNFNENPFTLIGDKWMLIAAGDTNGHNMMTASWGTLGVLWGKNIATVFIRPTRYTIEFIEKFDYFSLNFPINRSVHNICGSKSGRDIDKTKECKLTPVFKNNTVFFEESEFVLICKKIYHSKLIKDNFLVPEIEKNYMGKNYHKIFVGEIMKIYKNE